MSSGNVRAKLDAQTALALLNDDQFYLYIRWKLPTEASMPLKISNGFISEPDITRLTRLAVPKSVADMTLTCEERQADSCKTMQDEKRENQKRNIVLKA